MLDSRLSIEKYSLIRMSSYSTTTNAMAAFLNVEPATRTLDGVRFVFHFCNLVNLTLGAIAFGVGIGYDLIVINVEDDSYIRQIKVSNNLIYK